LTQRLIKISNKRGTWVEICHTPETIMNGKECFCNILTETDLDDMWLQKSAISSLQSKTHQFTWNVHLILLNLFTLITAMEQYKPWSSLSWSFFSFLLLPACYTKIISSNISAYPQLMRSPWNVGNQQPTFWNHVLVSSSRARMSGHPWPLIKVRTMFHIHTKHQLNYSSVFHNL
jgi:hypothetical protein